MNEHRKPKSDGRSVPDHVATNGTVFWIWADDAGEISGMFPEGSSGKWPPPKLMERVAVFGDTILRFAKKSSRGDNHPETRRWMNPLVGAANGIGANYGEAEDAVSGKDFKSRIGPSRMESNETMLFFWDGCRNGIRAGRGSAETLAESQRVESDIWSDLEKID